MKRLLALLLCLCLVLCLGACGGGNEDITPSDEPSTEGSKPEESTGSTQQTGIVYKVKVVDDDGNPLAGVMVQLCKDMCVPAMTNAEGVAEFNQPEDDYHVSVASMPAGYEYSSDVREFFFDEGSYELTIVLNIIRG